MSDLLQIKKNALSNHPLFLATPIGQLLQKDFLGFVDIGARGGVHELVESIASVTSVLGFEPEKEECDRLNNIPEVHADWAEFQLEPVGLFDSESEQEIKILTSTTNNSLYAPNDILTKRYNMEKWQLIGTEKIKTQTLDALIFGKYKSTHYMGEFMKLDTQGSEYEILQGAKRVLSERTEVLVVEVAFCELYKGQKLFSDIEALLRSCGFSFYGFSSMHHRSKKLLKKRDYMTKERMIYADAVFFKDPLDHSSDLARLNDKKASVLILCAILLNYYDFALELAQAYCFDKRYSAEKEALIRFIKALAQLPQQQTCRQVQQLYKEVDHNPEWANIIAGNFVDRHRHYCNYDDVLDVSPLPKTY